MEMDSKHDDTDSLSGDDQHTEKKKGEPTSPFKSAMASVASRALAFLKTPGGTPLPTDDPAADGSSSTN